MSNNNKEMYALTPISKEKKQGWVPLAFVQAGICVCVPSFLEGALLVDEMNFWPAILSGTVGYVIVVIAMTVLGFIGSDLGLASVTITESTLGKQGARYIAGIIFAINLIGWFGINNGECALSFVNFMSSSFGVTIPFWASCIFWGLIMTLTAAFGMKTIEKLDYVSIPLLMLAMLIGTVMAIKLNGIGTVNDQITPTMSFIDGVALSFDFYAVGVITAADITRFQKSRRDTTLSTVVGVFPLGVITLVLGALLTKIAGDYDIASVLITVGIPVLGVIALVLSTWTTNASNAYSGALDTVAIFNITDNRRREVTVIVGVLGTILGMSGIVGNIETFLGYLAFLVCPIGGIMFTDYFIFGRGKPENWHSRKGFYWVGVLTWVISGVISIILNIDFIGMFIAIPVYWILEMAARSMSNKKEQQGEQQ